MLPEPPGSGEPAIVMIQKSQAYTKRRLNFVVTNPNSAQRGPHLMVEAREKLLFDGADFVNMRADTGHWYAVALPAKSFRTNY